MLREGGFWANFKAAAGLGAGAGFGWTLGQEVAKWLIRLVKWAVFGAIGIGMSFLAQCNNAADKGAYVKSAATPPAVAKKLERR